MKLTRLLAIPVLLSASAATADLCEHTAPHRLTAALNGASTVVIVGRAGSLRVTGSSTGTVSARGTACSSDRDFLSDMRIEARREGSELRIEAIIPERTAIFHWHNARLDLEVTVPDSVAIRVKDGSGSLEVRDVASLDIADGSGEIEIRGVRGNVEVSDGSGAITIAGVGGDVRVSDGSGGLEIARVDGSVVVDEDGSGGIDVADVRGSFTVGRDGSGGVNYERIAGTVRVPKRR